MCTYYMDVLFWTLPIKKQKKKKPNTKKPPPKQCPPAVVLGEKKETDKNNFNKCQVKIKLMNKSR